MKEKNQNLKSKRVPSREWAEERKLKNFENLERFDNLSYLMHGELSILNKTGKRLPRLPFASLKDDILGKKYSLSIALVDEKTSHTINKQYRKKDKPTNVLSFELSENSGELVLCPDIIKKETEKFGKDFKNLFGFLVIHGMLHLKGMTHSSKIDREEMELAEKKYDQKYFNRNRHRLSDHKSGSGRIFKGRKIS